MLISWKKIDKDQRSDTVIQTVRDHTCLPQAGTSDIRLKLKIRERAQQKGHENTSRVNSLSKKLVSEV